MYELTRKVVSLLACGILACTTTAKAEKQVSPAHQISTSPAQALIEVEVRFIEISQSDMDDLDIQWSLDQSGKDSSPTNISPPQATGKTGRKSIPASRSPLPHTAGFTSAISNISNEAELSSLLRNLEQVNGINSLSAPKVTTRSGENAEIKIVHEIIYPVDFQIQSFVKDKKTGEISLMSSNETVKAPNTVVSGIGISKFETRETGVILNITPELEPEGETIMLDIKVEVCELADWIDYGSTMQYLDGDLKHVRMMQPIFHSRKLVTSISMLDGQTTVMGGLVKEGTSTRTDKVPFFGSIPLLGRLFRSETILRVKTNLLILVTARKKPG